MRTLLAGVIALSGTRATMKQIQEQLDSRFQNITSSFRDTVYLGFMYRFYTDYGCWCHFSDDYHYTLKGTPVDPFDQLCKDLHDAYECVTMEEGPECVPWSIQYIPIRFTLDVRTPELIVSNCAKYHNDIFGDQPETACRSKACAVETHFVESVSNLLLHHMNVNPDFEHKNGFDPEQGCIGTAPHAPGDGADTGTDDNGGAPGGSGGNNQSTGGNGNGGGNGGDGGQGTGGGDQGTGSNGGGGQKECCGTIPFFKPYRTLGGSRKCCGNKTYNSGILLCCDDGTIATTC